MESFDNISYVFSADGENLAERGIIGADSVVQPSKRIIPVRIYLPTGERKRIYKGTRLGFLEQLDNEFPVSELFYSMNNEENDNKQDFLNQFKLTGTNFDLIKMLW